MAYKVNLDDQLAARLRRHLADSPKCETNGEVAVEAIRSTRSRLNGLLLPNPADPLSTLRRPLEGRVRRGAPTTPIVFYITMAEAVEIKQIQDQLGRVEMGQLHRLALDAYLS